MDAFFQKLDGEHKVSMLILKGDGGKAFCAGGDVRCKYRSCLILGRRLTVFCF